MPNRAPRITTEQVNRLVAYLSEHAFDRRHARTWRLIASDLRLGKNADREIRALANAANESGHLICTGNSGYWLATGPDDIRETAGRLRSQAQKMLRRAAEIERQGAIKFDIAPAVPSAGRRRRDVSELQMVMV